jgi:hypothetical protein
MKNKCFIFTKMPESPSEHHNVHVC